MNVEAILMRATPEHPAEMLRKMVMGSDMPITSPDGEVVGKTTRMWFDEENQALMCRATLDPVTVLGVAFKKETGFLRYTPGITVEEVECVRVDPVTVELDET